MNIPGLSFKIVLIWSKKGRKKIHTYISIYIYLHIYIYRYVDISSIIFLFNFIALPQIEREHGKTKTMLREEDTNWMSLFAKCSTWLTQYILILSVENSGNLPGKPRARAGWLIGYRPDLLSVLRSPDSQLHQREGSGTSTSSPSHSLTSSDRASHSRVIALTHTKLHMNQK